MINNLPHGAHCTYWEVRLGINYPQQYSVHFLWCDTGTLSPPEKQESVGDFGYCGPKHWSPALLFTLEHLCILGNLKLIELQQSSGNIKKLQKQTLKVHYKSLVGDLATAINSIKNTSLNVLHPHDATGTDSIRTQRLRQGWGFWGRVIVRHINIPTLLDLQMHLSVSPHSTISLSCRGLCGWPFLFLCIAWCGLLNLKKNG